MATNGTTGESIDAKASRNPGRTTDIEKCNLLRADLLFLFLLGAVVIWLPSRPPMVDLPQHAAQITLLNDLLTGHSQWSNEVKLNVFTPYLIGYAIASPLHLFMPAAAALKVVLTGAYAAFISICLLIRRDLNGSDKLDGFFTLPFFGFAYSWGMYTFLVAAPLGLGFVWLCLRYSRQSRPVWGAALAAMGLVLVFCHGLVLLYAVVIGGLLVLVHSRVTDLRQLFSRCWPFLPPLLMCGLVFVLTIPSVVATYGQFSSKIEMDSAITRFLTIILGSFDGFLAYWSPAPFFLLLALPFIAGLRIAWSRERLVIVGTLGAALLFAPSTAWSTAFLYQRLTLFLLPTYAWLFGARPPVTRLGIAVGPSLRVAANAVCVLVLGINLVQAYRFSSETRDFEAVLEKALPEQRALSLIFDRGSADGAFHVVYLNFPAWYAADKHGLVDFNFAYYHTEIVGFRRRPLVDSDFSWDPGRFRWDSSGGSTFRYFFVRTSRPLPSNFFAGAECSPVRIAQKGLWQLFEHRPCPSAALRRKGGG